eukprot:CFRG2100T1
MPSLPIYTGLIGYALSFAIGLTILTIVYRSLPPLVDHDGQQEQFKVDAWPTTSEEWVRLAKLLAAYRDQHYNATVGFFLSLYLFKQTFSVPGSAIMNIVAGVLWGFPLGLMMVCTMTTAGSSLCFVLSRKLIGQSVKLYFPQWISYLKSKVQTGSSKDLFLDLMAMRVIPFTPNWALNLCLPHLSVPLPMFAVTVFFGLMPYNFVCVQAGTMATGLQNPSDMIRDPDTLLRLSLIGVFFMGPRIWRSYNPKDSMPTVRSAISNKNS